MKEWSNLAKVVTRRTYSRNDFGTLENWDQIIERAVAGNVKGCNVSDEEVKKLLWFGKNRKAIPAGRGLWFSGSPAHDKLGSIATCNCFFLALDDWSKFVIGQDLLMCGAGVGASIEARFVSKIPTVKKDVTVVCIDTKDADFIVPDSREGWCELTRRVLEAYFSTGKSFSYSTVCVRNHGEKIKGFGGTASGAAPLRELVENINGILAKRAGKHLRGIDAMDILCCIGAMVVSGNIRRSAILILGDAFDKEFLKSKRWSLGNIPNWRAFANLTVVAEDADDLGPLFWRTYSDGEPFGIFNRKATQKYGRIGELKKDVAIGINPCITGDTLVAVADGRVHVPIKQLAEEGKDVPVYCLNKDNGNVCIRYMRSPRITGYNIPVVKVTLDNGQSVTVTEDHKLLLNSKGYVEAKDLQPGDSLRTLPRTQQKNGSNNYWYLWDRELCESIPEHRVIASFTQSKEVEGYDVHHVNRNSLDNSWSNLQVLTKSEHSAAHGDQTYGEGNSRFLGCSNEDLKAAALKLTKSLNRMATCDDWLEFAEQNGYPKHFSKWRVDHLGAVGGLLSWAADQLGLLPAALQTVKTCNGKQYQAYRQLLDEGYDAVFHDGHLRIRKLCEVCSKEILVFKKGAKYCGSRCQNLARSEDVYLASSRTFRKTTEARMGILRTQQAKVFDELRKSLGRRPSKKEWVQACKASELSFEISRVSSPFRGYTQLETYADNLNHKVVSVEPAGIATVYNGTVDEYSNFFIGGFSELTRSGLPKFVYINNLNCAEATLSDLESCNLQDIALPSLDSEEEFIEAARLMHRYGKRITLKNFHNPAIDEAAKKYRRIGTGITGCLASPLYNAKTLDRVYNEVQLENVEYSKFLNIEQSIRTTVVKPSGTVSKVLDMDGYEGIHAAYSRYIIQRIRFNSADALIPKLKQAGHYMEPVRRFDGSLDQGTMVVDFYQKAPDGYPVADEDWGLDKQLQTITLANEHWSDQATSCTIYYRLEELDKVKDWINNNMGKFKTISFLLHSGHSFIQAPKTPITQQQYEKLAAKVKPIDIEDILEGDMEVDECAGGVCPVK